MIPPHVDEIQLALLDRLERHHRPTAARARRVRNLTALVAPLLGIEGEDLERLSVAAALHDIGKLDVPAGMLDWPGELDAKQRAIVDGHAGAGLARVAPLADWLGPWLAVVDCHHESWPEIENSSLPGNVCAGTGLVSVASAYVAMTRPRTYAPIRSGRDAIKDLVADSRFNPHYAELLGQFDHSRPRPFASIDRAAVTRSGKVVAKIVGAAVVTALLATGANTLVGADSNDQALAIREPPRTTMAPNTLAPRPSQSSTASVPDPTLAVPTSAATEVLAPQIAVPSPTSVPTPTAASPTTVFIPKRPAPKPSPPKPAPAPTPPPTPAPTPPPPPPPPPPAPPPPPPPPPTTPLPTYDVYVVGAKDPPWPWGTANHYITYYSYRFPPGTTPEVLLQWMATANCQPEWVNGGRDGRHGSFSPGRRVAIPHRSGLPCGTNY